jgi:hypothetical protein
MVEIANRTRARKEPADLFVNSQLEGNAPGTVEAVADRITT